jgi:hypothetical protein
LNGDLWRTTAERGQTAFSAIFAAIQEEPDLKLF